MPFDVKIGSVHLRMNDREDWHLWQTRCAVARFLQCLQEVRGLRKENDRLRQKLRESQKVEVEFLEECSAKFAAAANDEDSPP